jgi:uncharacterized protein with PQ loop repeat
MATHAHINHSKKPNKHPVLDGLVTAMAVVGPLFGLPQVYEIYVGQDASGVSLASWLGFSFYTLVFLTYGIVYKLKPVIIAQSLWLCIYILIISGILLYG